MSVCSSYLTVAWIAGCASSPGATDGGSTGPAGASTSAGTGTSSGTSTASDATGPTSGPVATASTSSEAGDASSDAGETGGSSTAGPGESSSGTSADPSTTTGDPVAVALAVQNPGFEADVVANGNYDDKIVPMGWTKYDPQSILGQDYNSLGVLNPTGTALYPAGAPEGSNVALVFLWREQTNGLPAGFVQQLGDTLQASTEYTLRVKVGNIAPMGNAPYELAGFPGYRVELLAGDAVLAADDGSLSPADGEFLQSEISFTSTADPAELGAPLKIRLINMNMGDSGIEVNFDDVELFAAPAP